MYEMGEQLERVILAGVQTYESDDTVQSLYELRELAETAGAVTVGTIMQSRETIHPATYLGKGKLEELKGLLYDLDATGVICDDELSPAQLNNLEQELECKVMDRTMVILDNFCAACKDQRRKDPGRTCTIKVPGGKTGRYACFAVSSRRWHWYPWPG